MATKKYTSLLGVLIFLATGLMAQMSKNYDIYDSSVISSRGSAQHSSFMENKSSYPAMPRNMLEVGVDVGNFAVNGDVVSKFPSLSFSAHVRKALGYVFSLRLQYLYGKATGMNWQASQGYDKNSAWKGYNAPIRTADGRVVPRSGTTADLIYYNFRTKVQDLGLQGIFTLNNIRFHKQLTGLVVYGGVGIGASAYETFVNAQKDGDNSGRSYAALFNTVRTKYAPIIANKKSILNDLKAGMDNTYETRAQNQAAKRRKKFGTDKTLRASGSIIGGIAYKISNRLNIALEDRQTFLRDDLLDGQQYQEDPIGDAALTSDFDAYNYLSLGLNFNLGSKAVEPLWWLNPLDYAYSELTNPRHMKLPTPTIEDADGDGVIDQLDREPNTPAGCPVDTHGVTKDTDGDGIADCKDKQLITPTECQPVDADGVGKCPDPACCTNIKPDTTGTVATDCPCDYPSLSFKGTTAGITTDAKGMLATVAAKMKANPSCSINVSGYPGTSKASQDICKKRVDAVKIYLVGNEGISADRINTNCEIEGGDKNTVDIKCN